MSRLTDLDQIRHYILDLDEVEERLGRIKNDLGIDVTVFYSSNPQDQDFSQLIYRDSTFSGLVKDNNFSETAFIQGQIEGDISGNNFSDADFIATGIKGNISGNRWKGAYLRYCDIGQATFNQNPPELTIGDQDLKINNQTGRILFCGGVEESMCAADNDATYMPITLNFDSGMTLPFIGRLFNDGVHFKSGLISLADIQIGKGEENQRLWPGFIYTISNSNSVLRDLIKETINKNIPTIQKGVRIIDHYQFDVGAEFLNLRPARPLDMYFLIENWQNVPELFQQGFGKLTSDISI